MPAKTPSWVENEVCRLRSEGMPTARIIDNMIVSEATVLRILARNGMSTRRPDSPTDDQEAEIAAQYRDGTSVKQLALRWNYSQPLIRRVLIAHGVGLRTRSDSIRLGRGTQLREDAFDTITEESAYWIGFLMADGTILERADSYNIELSLSARDRDHVEKFRSFLGANHKITEHAPIRPDGARHPAVRLSVGSKRLGDALIRHGVTPRKSATAKVIGLEANRDFWRGVIDGDGCLSVRGGYPVIQLAGSMDICLQFRQFARSLSPGSYAGINQATGVYIYYCCGPHALKMIEVLYAGCKVSLDRKQAAADDILANPGSRRRQRWHEFTIDQLDDLHATHGSWRRVAKVLEVEPSTLMKIAKRLRGQINN